MNTKIMTSKALAVFKRKNFSKSVFVWTEAFNCGELLDPFLSSYLTHNSEKIHVFCGSEDYKMVTVKSENIEFHLFDESDKEKKIIKKIRNGYKNGHKGTAELWAYLISKRAEGYFIHLDADTIFLGEVISDIKFYLIEKQFALVGSRRPYKNRNYRLKGLDSKLLNKRPDTVNTDCFGFNVSKIGRINRIFLRRKIQGRRTSLLPVVDFFDPISFLLIRNADVHYIDSPNEGYSGCTDYDDKFMKNRISFSAVGSGINFYKNPWVKTSSGYKEYALSSYALYSKYILDREIEVDALNHEPLVKLLKSLNKNKWILDE